MPASEAQVLANRANSLKSTGPSTREGKEKSRANALKHGLTGEGVALTSEDAAEVERMFVAFEADFRPSDESGRVLIRRAATCAVRMERGVLQETAALNERVLKAQAQVDLDGEDRDEAGRRAMFDPSKEATLARRYEAAAEGFASKPCPKTKPLRLDPIPASFPAERGVECRVKWRDRPRNEGIDLKHGRLTHNLLTQNRFWGKATAERGFFRALKEFRQLQRESKAPDVKSEAAALRKQRDQLASFFPAVNPPSAPAKPAVASPLAPPKPASKPAPAPVKTVFPAWNPVFGGSVDVPITIGRPR